MTIDERKAVLEDELYILRDSGEIPEIAYHSTLFFLTQDPEGPTLVLTDNELELLQDAVITRYQEIVLRDITPENRDLTLYRGVRRTLHNWQRMEAFCVRNNRDNTAFKEQVRHAFLRFIKREVAEIEAENRKSSLNCSWKMIAKFAGVLGLDTAQFPDNWQEHCLGDKTS
ncbi:MAG: hypothetical protein DSY50_01695 [Desulfobulbus sp.]|nr:MAG: hypothetical protein DSY58_06040 [Desulfobulbus sp.]RUM36815.1 MAG: hypothetical protein DSY50_01695 [Desulfobulbus sp.]